MLSVLSIQDSTLYAPFMTVVDKEIAKSERDPEWRWVLKRRREALGLSQEMLAANTGDLVKQSDVSRVENAHRHPIFDLTVAQLNAYIQALEWSMDEFEEETGLRPFNGQPLVRVEPEDDSRRRVSVYDGVGAGPGFSFGEVIDVVNIPKGWKGNYCAFVVRGDSMSPTIQSGAVVVVKMGEPGKLGDTVLAYHPDHELVIKKLVITTEKERKAVLASNNPNYADILICDGCEIKGVVKRIIPRPIDL